MNKLLRPTLLTLLLGVALGACRDDLQDRPEGATSEVVNLRPTADYIGEVNFAIEADVMPMPDQEARANMSFSMVSRTDKKAQDGSATPARADYSEEFAPRMTLTKGDKVVGILVFIHDDGTSTQTVFRQQVRFEVIEGVETRRDGAYIGATGRNRVRYVGNVNFPSTHSLANEYNANLGAATLTRPEGGASLIGRKSRWKVMAILGYHDRTSLTTADAVVGTASAENNRLLFGLSTAENMFAWDNPSVSSGSPSLTAGELLLNAPCVSRWEDVVVFRSPGGETFTGANFDMRFQPQGVILQYDVTSLQYDPQEIRQLGVVSNVLDFAGYYDLNSEAVREAYRSKDASEYGIPEFKAVTPSMDDYAMYYTPTSQSALSSGERSFPWDMPTLSRGTGKFQTWPSGAGNAWSVTQGAISNLNVGGRTGQVGLRNYTVAEHFYWLTNTPKLWLFSDLGGRMSNRQALGRRRIYLFWGMPRKEANLPATSQRATYLYMSMYSLLTSDDAFNPQSDNFDTWYYNELEKEAINRSNEVADLHEAGQTAQANYSENLFKTDPQFNPYPAQFPGPLYPAYMEAKRRYNDYARQAREQVTPRTQQLLVLHQTDRSFPERKIYHAQTVVQSDLMLSEVIYNRVNGQNYTLLELSNPTMEPLDLTQYAIARLIPSTDGSYLAYRSPQGTPVERLEDALLLPLTAILGESDPFQRSALSSLKPASYAYDQTGARARAIYYPLTTLTATTTGVWSGRWSYFTLLDNTDHPEHPFYLLQGQQILLGASGYVNRPVTELTSMGYISLATGQDWFEPYRAEMVRQGDQGLYNLRYSYAYADGVSNAGATASFGEGTLDYRPGDAFVLVKKTAGGWQIIDATGPVGRRGLAFAGTYADFKRTFDALSGSTSFSQQRLDGVDYPFIAPYRTARINDARWSGLWSDDWEIKTVITDYTPGRRFHYNDVALQYYSVRNPALRRTPRDQSFTTYQQARPTRGY